MISILSQSLSLSFSLSHLDLSISLSPHPQPRIFLFMTVLSSVLIFQKVPAGSGLCGIFSLCLTEILCLSAIISVPKRTLLSHCVLGRDSEGLVWAPLHLYGTLNGSSTPLYGIRQDQFPRGNEMGGKWTSMSSGEWVWWEKKPETKPSGALTLRGWVI